MKNKIAIIILAAGKGTRMASEEPKALALLKSKPFLKHILDTIKTLDPKIEPVIVVGHKKERVKELLGKDYIYAEQSEQLGTGHAVMSAKHTIGDRYETILVLYADQPLVSKETLKRILEKHLEKKPTITLATVTIPDFKDWRSGLYHYGRIIRGDDGLVKKIVELKDANELEKKVHELNPALYAFNAKWLWKNIDKLKNENTKKEFYLTEIVKIACNQDEKIETVPVEISIPVKMDDGSMKIFEGYRVEYNNTLGPYKGGIRYHPKTEINEVKALAFWMVLKCAVAGIPMGGGKGGITVEPKDLSKGELERLSRGWVRGLSDILGPHKDVPAPDVNTTPEIMAWMADEYGKITGDKTGATFTGKPIEKGGSEGRSEATGLGGFYIFNSLRKELKLPEKCTVVMQGFGNVGGNAARIFNENGHTVVAVSDSKSAIFKKKGLDLEKVEAYKKNSGNLKNFPGAENMTNEQLLELPCDLLVPAAFENVITEKNASKIQAKVILELANGPITPEADEILFKKGISVIPDILANSGGVTVSYFEWDQNLKNEQWKEKEVFQKLKLLMEDASKKVSKKAKESKTSLRIGAFILALERIEAKMDI